MLYIKINPCDSDLIATHLIVRLECQGPPGPLEEDLKGAFGLLGGPLKCKYVKFEGLLACYLSDLMPQASLSCTCCANCAHQLKMHVWFF